jgi:hypothetical protein
MVGVLDRSDKESHSAATARGVPRRQCRGGRIGADEGRMDEICRLVPAM